MIKIIIFILFFSVLLYTLVQSLKNVTWTTMKTVLFVISLVLVSIAVLGLGVVLF